MDEQDFMSQINAGSLMVRLAEGEADIDAAQSLRYRVFYEEMAAQPSDEMALRKRDFDQFDRYCHHLLVIDRDRPTGSE